MAIAFPIRLTEGAPFISAVASLADSCGAVLTDSTSVLVIFSVSDSITLTVSDQASAVATIGISDSLALILSESTSVLDPNTASITASDGITARIASEVVTLSATSLVQDTHSIALTDSVSSLQVFTGQSTNNVSVSDSLQVRLNGAAQPPPTIPVSVTEGMPVGTSESILYSVSAVASDSGAVRVTESANAPAASLIRSDSVQVGLAEPGDQQSSFGVTDSIAVQAGDTAPLISGSFSFNVTDSLAVQQAELTAFGTSTVVAVDSIRVVNGESLANSASVFASDSLRTSTTEAVSTFKSILSTDTLAAQLTDSASPIFNSFVGVAATDSCSVLVSESISELISFLRQFTVTDSLSVLSAEGGADQFVSMPAIDQLASQVNEFADIWNVQSLAESVKVGTIESGLAIPIVSVNVSAFADDTILGTADGVASVSIVYEAFEYIVSDTCSIQGSDEARLQVGQYWEDELLVAVGDTASDTAVANASPETWNGHIGTEHRNDKPKPWKYIFTDKLNW